MLIDGERASVSRTEGGQTEAKDLEFIPPGYELLYGLDAAKQPLGPVLSRSNISPSSHVVHKCAKSDFCKFFHYEPNINSN